jgi:hypothetical protein
MWKTCWQGVASLFPTKPSVSGVSPHFSQGGYCGGGSIRSDHVMLHRPSRRTDKYDCEGLGRKPCQDGLEKPPRAVFTASLRNLVKNAG